MPLDEILAGSTSNRLPLYILDSTSTTGAGLTGITGTSSGLTSWYWRENATANTAITLSNGTLGTFASGTLVAVANGAYQFCIPDAAVAAGANDVLVYLGGATNMVSRLFNIALKAVNAQDAVHFGLSCLPNTAVSTNASLLTSGTGTDQISVTSGRIDIGKALGVAVTLDANNVLNVSAKYWAGGLIPAPTVAGVPNTNVKTINDVSTSPVTTVKAVQGLTTADTILTYFGNTPQTGDAYLRLGTPVGASTSADIASTLSAIQNVQNNTFISDNFQGDIERPDSGSETIQIAFVFSDETGTAANLDSGNPIMVLTNNAGTDLSSRLGSWSNPATGKYVRTYTNSASDAIDGLLWEVTATIHSKLRRKPGRIQIVDTTAVDFTSSDRTNLNALVAGVTLSPSQGGVTFSSLSTGGGTLSLGVAVVQNLGILSLTVVDGNVALTTLNPTTMNVGTFAAGAGTLSTILTNVAAVKTDTAAVKVDTTATTSMFEAGIGAGVYRYTAASLVNAPSGGLTAQQVANALLLAPVGSAAAGSAMQELGTLYQLVDTGQFTAFALANAPAGGDVTVSLTVSPIKAVVDAGSVTGESFVIYQNSAGARSFVITDSNGAPVSLAGKHVRFTASDRRNMNEPVITLDNFSVMGLVVVTNTVTATFTAAMSATIRSLAYSIWNVTDNMPVAQGTMKILSISQEEP